MAKNTSFCDPGAATPYIAGLDITFIERYNEKLRDIDGVDPYQLPKEAFSSDQTLFPNINSEDIEAKNSSFADLGAAKLHIAYVS